MADFGSDENAKLRGKLTLLEECIREHYFAWLEDTADSAFSTNR